MTSLSLRKPRTTAPRTTRGRTGISRAALAAVAALAAPLAAAAAEPGFVPIPPATPAAVYPPGTVRAVGELPPAPLPPVPEAAGLGVPRATPARVVVLQSPVTPPAAAGQDPDVGRSNAANPNPTDVRQIYEQRYGKLPGKLEVFRLESEGQLERRILHELKRDKTPKDLADNRFPPSPKLAPDGSVYTPKTVAYPPVKALIEPPYVVHRRLYFEEKNSERYGWDLGFVQPVVSALTFYKDVLVFPAKLGSNPHERYDTSAGKCLPGSPVPYFLYPPEVDIWGATFAASMYTGTAFLFP